MKRTMTLAFGVLALCFFACNGKAKKTTTETKVTIQDIKQVEKSPEPPPPPIAEQGSFIKKCYTNGGLKYNVILELKFIEDKYVTGIITSEEWRSNQESSGEFIGTIENNKVTITKYTKKKLPTVGDASEWTSKPWTITDKKISIPFRAKNYKTNKWEEINYDFEITACK